MEQSNEGFVSRPHVTDPSTLKVLYDRLDPFKVDPEWIRHEVTQMGQKITRPSYIGFLLGSFYRTIVWNAIKDEYITAQLYNHRSKKPLLEDKIRDQIMSSFAVGKGHRLTTTTGLIIRNRQDLEQYIKNYFKG